MPECGRKNELESGGRRAGLFAKRNPAMQANCVLGKTNWPNAGLAAEPPSLSYETKPLRSGIVYTSGAEQPGFRHRLHPGPDIGKKTGQPEDPKSPGTQESCGMGTIRHGKESHS